MAKLIYSLLSTALIQLANLGYGVAAARLLGPYDRGILAYQVTLSMVVATLLSFGISEAVSYKAATKSEGFVHTNYVALSIAYGAIGSLSWLVVYPIMAPISSPDQYRAYLVFTCYPVLNYITISFVAWFAGAGLTKSWNVQRLLVQVIQPLALACFLTVEIPSIFLFALSIVAAHVVAAVVGCWQISLSAFLEKPRWAEMKEILVLGTQTSGGRVSNLIRDNADKLIVGALATPEILAQYIVSVSFAQVFNAYSQTIVQLYFSRIAQNFYSKTSSLIETRSAALIVVGAATAVLASFIVGKWLVIAIFGHKFAMAGDLAPYLVIGMAFASVKSLISAHALAMRKPLITSKIDFYAVVPTLVLMFLSVRYAGAWGAVGAFTTSQGIIAVAMCTSFWMKSSELRRSKRLASCE
ncbi:lipopolysaccharide biosynthesis protein [Bradyrhizobium genosp. SA-3]|uniref:lipopolysaccharide biosynthesis protein n=1 Tax=Bradyrhizobium genosp. SA-3 TaxID=508868 RepID=UPI0013EE5D50|nr:oligosaccharide flippase family protein [Bradyrhizobium genosp. SA-3]